MIAIDVGNTKTCAGYFEGDALADSMKISTVRHRLRDDYLLLLRQMFPRTLHQSARSPLIVSSVVPSATRELQKLSDVFEVHIISHSTPRSFEVAIETPHTIGPDRIADSEAAIHEYGVPVIIVDAGTATTITAIDSNRRFIGGVICPGLGISSEALFKSAAALSQIKIETPPRITGNSTEKALQSGICYGHSLMIQGLVNGIKSEHPSEGAWKTVVTGGTADLLSSSLPEDYVRDPSLTLKGLRRLAGRILGGA